jgi:hypothetical protein
MGTFQESKLVNVHRTQNVLESRMRHAWKVYSQKIRNYDAYAVIIGNLAMDFAIINIKVS